MNSIIIKLKTSITICFLLITLICSAQISKENVYKKYSNNQLQKNDAVLVLYKDGTFVNFGLVADNKAMEWYMWLTSGTYTELSDKILLKSTLEVEKMGPLVQNIKNHYKYRGDYSLIASDYEKQLENYKDLPLTIVENKLIDSSKKIEYTEEK